MSKLNEELIKAIDELHNNYDAFYIYNKYSSTEDLKDNTNQKEFELLLNKFKNDPMCMKAIKWIMNCYDCFYKNEFNDGKDAFSYLKNKLLEEE